MRRVAGFAAAALISAGVFAAVPANSPTSHAFVAVNGGYFARHATAAVHWNRWTTAVLSEARRSNKPLFLSIGYAGCRWCEAMQRESFAEPGIAEIVNRQYVPVLLDADEQPDVAAACSAFFRSATPSAAGLPLNVVLSPDLWPLVGIGYAPSAELRTFLIETGRRWSADGESMLKQASDTVARSRTEEVTAAEPLASPGDLLAADLQRAFDPRNGGFGSGQKSLSPVILDFLIRRGAVGDDRSRDMALLTLRGIFRGGIYDRVGGGFHDRALDPQWKIPEFTQRLASESLMALTLIDSWKVRHDATDEQAIRRLLDYLLRDARDRRGALFSGEGGESLVAAGGPHLAYGASYTWSVDEVRLILGKDAALIEYYFGLKSEGNVPSELDPRHDLAGRNVLYVAGDDSEARRRFGFASEAELATALTAALDRLLLVRSHRPPPAIDDQVISGWNGLAMSAFARAGATFGDRRYATAAVEVARFIESRLYDAKTKGLLRSAAVPAIPDDYASVIEGLIDLYEATYEPQWLAFATELQRQFDARFWSGTALRYVAVNELPPSVQDLAPDRDRDAAAANGIAARNLDRLAIITNDPALRARADAIFRSFAFSIRDTPVQLASVVSAYEARRGVPSVVIITGNPAARETNALLAEYHRALLPNSALLVVRSAAEQLALSKLAPVAASIDLVDIDGKAIAARSTRTPAAAAYVCQGNECGTRITEPQMLAAALRKLIR